MSRVRPAADRGAGDEPSERGESGARDAAGGTSSVSRMARGSGINLIGAICSQAALFLIMALLATRLNQATVGGYAECYAMLTLLELLALVGFRSATTRFVAMHLSDGDAGAVRGTVAFALAFTGGVSLLLGAALALASHQVAAAFHDPSLRTPVLLVALALPAGTFEAAALSATQGWRSQRDYAIVGSIVDPGVRLVLTAAFIVAGGGLVSAIVALVIGTWVGAVLAAVAVARRLRRVDRARRSYGLRLLFRFSVVSWGSTLATTGLVWADTLLLGNLSTQREVGSYTVATRLVTLAVFVMMPVTNALTPHMAHLFHTGDIDGTTSVYSAATRWIVRLSMPAFVALLIFPRDLLNVFGRGYRDAAAVTVILAIGQMVNAAAGPCGAVLNMSGRVAISLADGMAVLALNIALNLWLIPQHGMLGAAIAWCASLTIVNVTQVLQVRRILGVRARGTGLGYTAAAAVAAAGAGLLVRVLIDGWLPTLLVGCPVVLVVFVGVLVLTGGAAEDVAVARTFVPLRPRASRT